MARLLTAGFETGSLQELNGAAYGVTVPSTAEARTGNYALALMGAVIVGGTDYVTHVFDADEVELYFRIVLKLDALGIAGHPYIAFRNSVGANLLVLEFNGASQVFQLYQNNPSFLNSPEPVLLATGSIVFRAGIWYLIEGHIKINSSTGVFVSKANAVTDISYSGNTGADGVRSFKAFGPLGAAGGYVYLDDIAYNNPSGSFENSYPGLGGIFFLKANGAGATQDFTPSAGSDHDALVDDVPPNTTDWVQGENAGDLELFEIEDTPTYVTQINVVQPVFMAAVAVSGSNELRDVLYADSVEYPGSTTHTIISIDPEYVLYRGETYYEQPDGVSGAFDATALDALQVGIEIPA